MQTEAKDEKKKPKLLSEANLELREQLFEKAQGGGKEESPPEPPADPGKPPEEPEKPKTTVEDFPPAAAADKGSEHLEEPTNIGTPKEGEETPKPEKTPEETGGKKETKVPHEALHEARMRLETVRKERDELKEQNRILLDDIKKRDETPPNEEIADYDKEIINLRNKVATLETQLKKKDELEKDEQLRRVQELHRDNLEKANLELEKEGYSGFSELVPLVQQELMKIARVDFEKAQSMDNPEGWKKIFKETVLPRTLKLHEKKMAEEKKASKESLKEGASVLLPSGAPPAPPEPREEENSFEDYMERRLKKNPQPQSSGK